MGGGKESLKKFYNSYSMLLVLVVIFPVLYYMSSNYLNYSFEQYCVTILTGIGVCVCLILLLEIFTKFLIKEKITYYFKEIMFVILIYIINKYNLWLHFSSVFVKKNNLVIFLISFSVICLILMFYRKQKIINTFLGIICILCLFQYSQQIIIADLSYYLNGNKYSCNKEFENLKLKNKPNIYYIYLESYHGQEALKKLYNFDNEQLYSELRKKDFIIYPDTYSNWDHTLASLCDVFLMNHHFYFGKGYGLIRVIQGDKYNTVVNILKNNGYDINYVLPRSYIIRKTNKIVDNFNIPYSKFLALLLYGMPQGWQNYVVMHNKSMMLSAIDSNSYHYMVRTNIDKASNSEKPQFTFMEIGLEWDYINQKNNGVMHVSLNNICPEKYLKFAKWDGNMSDNYDYNMLKNWWANDYVEKVKKENTIILDTINYIEEKDPDSVIVLLGDHGAFQYLHMDVKGLKTLEKRMVEYNIDTDTIAKDYFNVLCAIKWPKSVRKKESVVISGVNLFRYIFSSLAENDDILKNKKSDISVSRGMYIFVKDGKPVEKPEKLVKEKYLN